MIIYQKHSFNGHNDINTSANIFTTKRRNITYFFNAPMALNFGRLFDSIFLSTNMFNMFQHGIAIKT